MSAQYRIDLPVGTKVVLQYQTISSPSFVKSDAGTTPQYEVSIPVGTEVAVVTTTGGFQIVPVLTTEALGSAALDSSSSSPRRSTL